MEPTLILHILLDQVATKVMILDVNKLDQATAACTHGTNTLDKVKLKLTLAHTIPQNIVSLVKHTAQPHQ